MRAQMAVTDKRRKALEALKKRRLLQSREDNREMREGWKTDHGQCPTLQLTPEDYAFLRALHIEIE